MKTNTRYKNHKKCHCNKLGPLQDGVKAYIFVFISLNNMINLLYHLIFFILHLCFHLTPGVA
jgi:hypothetical protein